MPDDGNIVLLGAVGSHSRGQFDDSFKKKALLALACVAQCTEHQLAKQQVVSSILSQHIPGLWASPQLGAHKRQLIDLMYLSRIDVSLFLSPSLCL